MKKLVIFLSLILFFIFSCSGQDEQQPSTDASETVQLAELQSVCGKYLYPALYYLEVPLKDYSWQDILIGQPADAFSDFIDEPEKDEILHQFEDYVNTGSTTIILNRIRKWCIAAIAWHEQDGSTLSTEEILAGFYVKEQYKPLFEPYQNRPVFTLPNAAPLDKIASLSSAELSDLINGWFTLLSGLPDQEFENSLIDAGLSVTDQDANF